MNIKNYKIDQKTRPIEWILKNRNFKIFLNCIIKQKNNPKNEMYDKQNFSVHNTKLIKHIQKKS